jgi:hypothetical protein
VQEPIKGDSLNSKTKGVSVYNALPYTIISILCILIQFREEKMHLY